VTNKSHHLLKVPNYSISLPSGLSKKRILIRVTPINSHSVGLI